MLFLIATRPLKRLQMLQPTRSMEGAGSSQGVNLAARAGLTWPLLPALPCSQEEPKSTDTNGNSHTSRHVASPWHGTAGLQGVGKETPSGTSHGRRGRRKEGVQGLDKIDGLVAIKKKISRWRLSY